MRPIAACARPSLALSRTRRRLPRDSPLVRFRCEGTMRTRLAFCLRHGVLCSALFACSTDSTGPEQPGPEQPLPPALSWSDPSAWPSGQVPAAGDSVVIPQDRTIRLDMSPPPLASLTINGALVFAETDLELTSGWILVMGTLRVGTSTQPFQHRATITLAGSSDGPNIMGMGNRVLGVAGGTLDLHGEARAGWTRLSSTAPAGATQLQLVTGMPWRSGDKLVLASTDFDPRRAEVVTVAT